MVIGGITPTSGSAGTGTQVTITGSGFGATQGSGNVQFLYRSTTTITAPIALPDGFDGSGASVAALGGSAADVGIADVGVPVTVAAPGVLANAINILSHRIAVGGLNAELLRLDPALGIKRQIPLHRRILADPDFQAGRITTAAVSPRLGPIAMGYAHRACAEFACAVGARAQIVAAACRAEG